MSAKTLGKLLVALAILGALAWFQTRQRSHPAEENGVAAGDSVLVGVDVNAVRSVFVERGGEKTELQRKADHWVVTSLFDYPADFQKLAAVLRKFDDLEVGQVVPDGTTYLDDFGLSTDSETNAPTLVKLASESGELLATLSLGAQKSGKPEPGGFGGFPVARYLQAGDGPVLLVDETLSDVQTDGAAWIEKNLLGLQPNEVKSLTVTLSNETYTVRSLGGSQYELEGLSGDEELDQTVCATLGRALQNVRCNDIANPALPDKDLGFDQPATLSVVAADGVAYRVALGTTSDDKQARFARFSVTAEPLPEPTREQAEDSVRRRQAEAATDTNTEQQVAADIPSLVDAELDTLRADYEAETEKLQQRVEELSRKFDGWTYLLSSYAADSMCFPRSDLVTAKVEPEPALDIQTADGTGATGQEPSTSGLAKPAPVVEEVGEIVPEAKKPPSDGADEGSTVVVESLTPASKPAVVADPVLESPEQKDPAGKESSEPDGTKPVAEAENVPARVAPTSEVKEQEDDATDVESRPAITSPPPVPGHPGTKL